MSDIETELMEKPLRRSVSLDGERHINEIREAICSILAKCRKYHIQEA